MSQGGKRLNQLFLREKSVTMIYSDVIVHSVIPWIIVGLGNPGAGYAHHRHSIGFRFLDAVAQAWSFPPARAKKDVFISTGHMEQVPILLCWPQAYMNRSGQALGPVIAAYRHAHWLVVHDELELPAGVIRWKNGGGTGGHNGLKSIHSMLGSQYQRLRIGIGRPADKEDVSSYVLSGFPPDQRVLVQQACDRGLQILPALLRGDIQAVSQRLQEV